MGPVKAKEKDPIIRKCTKCGASLVVKARIGDEEASISRGTIMDEKGNMFCSWWCKDEYRKEMDI